MLLVAVLAWVMTLALAVLVTTGHLRYVGAGPKPPTAGDWREATLD